ncbi:hypothetical protein J6590_080833 [Homalodisca vitripennis]|nr:hypothetical protein J6590_080833 [Homalodisca vitripennis]
MATFLSAYVSTADITDLWVQHSLADLQLAYLSEIYLNKDFICRLKLVMKLEFRTDINKFDEGASPSVGSDRASLSRVTQWTGGCSRLPRSMMLGEIGMGVTNDMYNRRNSWSDRSDNLALSHVWICMFGDFRSTPTCDDRCWTVGTRRHSWTAVTCFYMDTLHSSDASIALVLSVSTTSPSLTQVCETDSGSQAVIVNLVYKK